MSDSGNGGLVNAVGNIPIGGIPIVAPITIRREVHSGVELVHMLNNFFGGGLTAGQLHGELQPVCDDGSAGKAQLEHIRHVLNSTSGYTGNHLSTELNSILDDLGEAYQGAATAKMQTQFQKASTLLAQMSPAFHTLAGTIESTQTTLNTAWQVVKNYSRLHADESNVSSLNPFSSSDSDDDKAQNAWKTASASLQGIGNQAAGDESQRQLPEHHEFPLPAAGADEPAGRHQRPRIDGSPAPETSHPAPGRARTTPVPTTPVTTTRDSPVRARRGHRAPRDRARTNPGPDPGTARVATTPAPDPARVTGAPAGPADSVPAGPADPVRAWTPARTWPAPVRVLAPVSVAPVRASGPAAVARVVSAARPVPARVPVLPVPRAAPAGPARSRSAAVAAQAAVAATAIANDRPGSRRTTTYGATRMPPTASSPDASPVRVVLC